MDSVEKAKSGNLNISSFQLRRRKRRQRQFVCCCCKQKLSSTLELTKHMKEKHPGLQVHLQEMFQTFWDKKQIVQTLPLAFW